MAFKPSDRIKGEGAEELNLNLNSMMDMFAVLIPALLMMSAVVEVSIVSVKSPAIDGSSSPPPTPETPPLNLTVTILDSGYLLTGSKPPLLSDAQPGPGSTPTIPLVEKGILCARYRGTVPPPRSKNKDRPPCPTDQKGGLEQHSFTVYDTDALTRMIIDLKNGNPTERQVIIQPNSETEYETIVDVMDATRDVKEPSGEIRPLFDEVLISPSLM
jgi:biopolymer transport protein ExbD